MRYHKTISLRKKACTSWKNTNEKYLNSVKYRKCDGIPLKKDEIDFIKKLHNGEY